MPKKPSTRGGDTRAAAARNGRTVGRPMEYPGGKQYKVTIDQATLDTLLSINDNLSQAIRTLARQSHD